MGRISVSIDDVKGVFKALQKENLDSIFETRTIDFLQKLNSRYGTTFDMYCTYRHDEYTLSAVTNKYRNEFEKNKEWLRFGFHCIEENNKYENISEDDFRKIFEKFLNDLYWVTGQKECIERLRLHGFKGSREICCILRDHGVQELLASDDDRRNYYLDPKSNKTLLEKGVYKDEEIGITFITSFVRLENMNDTINQLNDALRGKEGSIPIFTHEWMLDDDNVRRRLEECCALEQKTRM